MDSECHKNQHQSNLFDENSLDMMAQSQIIVGEVEVQEDDVKIETDQLNSCGGKASSDTESTAVAEAVVQKEENDYNKTIKVPPKEVSSEWSEQKLVSSLSADTHSVAEGGRATSPDNKRSEIVGRKRPKLTCISPSITLQRQFSCDLSSPRVEKAHLNWEFPNDSQSKKPQLLPECAFAAGDVKGEASDDVALTSTCCDTGTTSITPTNKTKTKTNNQCDVI